MLSTDTSFNLTSDTASSVSRGYIEIDDELMLVLKVSRPDGVVTLLPTGGRGVLGTTAASHAANALIVCDPVFPRVNIKNAINDTIRSVYPNLYGVTTTEITKVSPVATYALPADVSDVLKVTCNHPGPDGVWEPIKRWRFDPTANTTQYATGKTIDIYDAVVPGMTIHVTYAKAPAVLSADNDDFAGVSGLPASCEDLIIYGTCYRLLPAVEAARLQQRSIEQSDRSSVVPAGSALNAAKFFLGLYQARMAEEISKLQTLYPVVAHYTR